MLKQKLINYKRRFYTNQLIKGLILTFSLILANFMLVNFLEYIGEFGHFVRGALFFIFISSTLICIGRWVIMPLSKLIAPKIQMSDQTASKQIGNYFPEVKDKLLNTLQLSALSQQETDLISASLDQKQNWLIPINFNTSIRLGKNRRYLRYLVPLFILFIAIFYISPELFVETIPRLVYYNKNFISQAPFEFHLLNKSLEVLKGDDLDLKLEISGAAIPEEVYLVLNNNRQIKMKKTGKQFSYVIEKLNKSQFFHFKASEFESKDYTIVVNPDPNLLNFNITLDYPKHTHKKDENVGNNGHLIIPEGTKITWNFKTQATEDLRLKFNGNSPKAAALIKKNKYRYEAVLSKNQSYQIFLDNEYGSNRNVIEYYISVVPDQHPSISLKYYHDTIVYDYLLLGGNIADDYGLTQLNLVYRILDQDNQIKQVYKKMPLPFNKKVLNQSYYSKMLVSDLGVHKNEKIEYYIEVFDNDGINGSKRSKTGVYTFALPSNQRIEEQVKKSSQMAQKQFSASLEESEDLSKKIEEIENRIKGKERLSWQDKKLIEQLIKDSQGLNKEIQKLKEENQNYNQQRDRFSNQNKNVKDKSDKLEQLINDLAADEEKKLLEELEKLLSETDFSEDIQKKLEDIKQQQRNLKRNLKRSLELFNRLKLEALLNDTKNQLGELAEEEEKLKQKTEEAKEIGKELEKLAEKQSEINEKFEDVKEKFKTINKINEELENPELEEDFKQEQQEIQQNLNNSQSALEKKDKQQAKDKQQKTIESLKSLQEKLSQQQQSLSLTQIKANYDDLKQILSNLLALSFSEEELNKQFEKIRQTDPYFVELSFEQLKLQQSSKVIADSLLALASRTFEIQSFIIKEVSNMERYIGEVIKATRQRSLRNIIVSQRYALTSINELALFLNQILENLLMQLSQGMAGQQMSEQRSQKPSLSQQQKKLNEQLGKIEKEQKKGKGQGQKGLSEKLAKIAAKQALIRHALEEQLKQQIGLSDNNNLEELINAISESQKDLISKKITKETIARQQEILTRLLKSEKADREREKNNEREARTADNIQKIPPKDILNNYLKEKEFQIELLKTIPASLNRYYKQQANKYLEKIHQ